MPIQTCQTNGRPGYRWGRSGKCYGYTQGDDAGRRQAKRKAIIQGIAAGERPSASLALNAELGLATAAAEEQLTDLIAAYETAIKKAGVAATVKFALTAAVADWQPPAFGAALTTAEIAALAASLNKKLLPVWTRIIVDIARQPLARIEIAWDVKHPLVRGMLANAAKRTGDRLGEAVQFTLRQEIAKAYEQGLSVREAAASIRKAISDAAPWQADMLARTDLNGLSNGASTAAARLTGMAYKSWEATLDQATRPEHAEAHGQTVPINGTFTVGGEEADYPGDPALSDAMAANCRCTVVYGETIDEAEGFVAAALPTSETEGRLVTGMATTKQRERKAGRRAAHAKGTVLPRLDFARLSADDAKTLMDLLRLADPKTVPVIEAGENGEDKLVGHALVAAARPLGFSGTAAIEGKISDDNSIAPRVLLPDSLSWPEMPLSFMAQTVTADAHDGAEVAGRVDEFSRKRGIGRLRNIDFAGELTTPFGIDEIAPMLEDKTMRYVSVDIGASEWSLIDRQTFEVVPDSEFDLAKAQEGSYALGLTSGKMKAVTLVPTQAIEGATVALTASADEVGIGIEDLGPEALMAIAASGSWKAPPARLIKVVMPIAELSLGDSALTASAAPVRPPRAWFETPEPPGKMPLTITEEGRVYGHLAPWDGCHISFLPQCLPPPKSPSKYARFHTAELELEGDDSIWVGKLMFSVSGGHAARNLGAARAAAHYDKTGMEAAYLRASDGQYGIWVAGSLNPDLTDEQRVEMRRQLRLHPPSGDWRIYDGQHDLLCALAVAVPGLPIGQTTVTITASAEGVEVTEAIIANAGWFEPDPAAVAALEHEGLIDEDALAERRLRVLAARSEGMSALASLIED